MRFSSTLLVFILATLSALFLTSMSGCQTTAPVVVPSIKCGQYLDKEVLTACPELGSFPVTTTYADLVKSTGELQVKYQTCAAKTKVLIDTINACQTLK